jgi:2Fe-2S ferredoxin
MVKVTFIEPDGKRIELDVTEGTTVRDAAVNNTVPGIDGDCGGQCACATCHIYVDDQWINKVGEAQPGSMEQDLLQLAEDVRLNSRLACQIPLSADLNGLVVHVPFGQH